MKKKPNIIILNGSPRAKGNTMLLAERAKTTIENLGGKVSVENLSQKKIGHCMGCWSTNDKKCKFPCVVKDDLNDIFSKMASANGIIFVSGVYWFGVSGLLKNLIDRMTSLWNNGVNPPLLNGKVAAFMSTSIEEGDVSAMAPLMVTSTFLGMHVLPYGLIYGHAKRRSDLKKGLGLGLAERCGRNMMSMIGILNESKADWWN